MPRTARSTRTNTRFSCTPLFRSRGPPGRPRDRCTDARRNIAMAHYDLIVIGSGTAAQVAIGQVRAAGWSVAVIDHRPFGGTCALRGCDPKKMLVSGEEAIDAAARMAGHGVGGDLAKIGRAHV